MQIFYYIIAVIISILPSANLFSQCIANAGKDTICCEFDPLNVSLGGHPSATGGSGNYQYCWSLTKEEYRYSYKAAIILDDTTIANPELISKPWSDTYFVLKVSDSAGYVCYDTVLILYSHYFFLDDYCQDKFMIPAGDSVRLCCGNAYSTHSPFRYCWKPGKTLTDSSQCSPYAKPSISTTYYCTMTDTIGCKLTFSNFVHIMNSIEENEAGRKIEIFPNPTSKMITINLNSDEFPNYQIKICNSAGIEIASILPQGRNVDIDLSPYPTGIYMLRFLYNGQFSFVKKCILY